MRTLTLLFLLFSHILASNQHMKIDFSKTILQTGAFKNQKMLEQLQSKLSAYTLFTKEISGLKKLFVINPTSSQIISIKKIVPKAFILSNSAKQKLFTDKKSDKKTIEVLNLNLQPSLKGLNTKTIITTRKKFFK